MASFGDRIVGAMKLNPATFQEVENDPTAMGQAVGVIVLAAVASGIGAIWFTGLTGLVMGVLRALVAYLIWAAIVWLIGTKVMPEPATKADFPETFRVVTAQRADDHRHHPDPRLVDRGADRLAHPDLDHRRHGDRRP